ncbi:MAG: dihydroneopterin aldolase [Bacteroidia bacterium]
MLTTIFIDQQLVHTKIGFYEIEKIVGVELLISARVTFERNSVHDNLSNTLNYADLSDIINHESKKSISLLETLGENIILAIENININGHKSTWVKIEKKQMLQGGFQAEGFGIEQSQIYGQ